jgi:DNA-binding NarL/FixJ family response regulator
MRRQHFLPIILVGKSMLLREGLARILRAANFRILASVSSPDDLSLCKPTAQTPLFLIVHAGNTIDTLLEQIEFLRSLYANGRIAVVSDHCRLDELTSAFRAGANGYFVNVATCDRFIKSVELVMMGETIFPPALLSFALDSGGTQTLDAGASDGDNAPILVATEASTAPLLSPREKLILRYIIEGGSNKCIARKIDITEATVKVHVKAILRKIRVQNRTQAAIWGMNNGSQTQLEDDSYPPSIAGPPISDTGTPLPVPVPEISGLTQIEGPGAYHAREASIKPMVRKSQTIPGTARLEK